MAGPLAAWQAAPSRRWTKIVKSDSTEYADVRGVCCGTAGTANLTDAADAAADNYPLQAGYNPISPKKFRLGGTADDIWILL